MLAHNWYVKVYHIARGQSTELAVKSFPTSKDHSVRFNISSEGGYEGYDRGIKR